MGAGAERVQQQGLSRALHGERLGAHAGPGELRLERMIDILTALGEPAAAGIGVLGLVRIAELVGRERTQVSRCSTDATW
ncbi:MAG: hypothetical protein QOC64_2204 [Solirubrobacteraceae bacterium]|nr:hypothetical protein [Solirubrobacteraceae bacterium]